MTCTEYRRWIEGCVDGSIDSDERRLLEAHTRECPACRGEYEACRRTEAAIRTALAPEMPASDALQRIEARLAGDLSPWTGQAVYRASRRMVAVAAGIALIVGLTLGYGLSRGRGTAAGVEGAGGPVVPIHLADVRGSVLFKHAAGASWNELTRASSLRVGDVFQVTPKSELVFSLADGSTVTLLSNSRLALDHCDGGLRLNLSAGGLRASLNSPHPPFIVNTPGGQLEALGTEFTVSVE